MAEPPHSSATTRALDALSTLVTTRRAAVLAVLLLVTLGLATQIPKIKADPAPENLISSFEREGEDFATLFADAFGGRDKVVALIIEADDVLGAPALGYMHRLTQHFGGLTWVDQADSVTNLTLPRRVRAGGAGSDGGGESLDDLDLDDLDGGEGESLEDLDDLEGADGVDGSPDGGGGESESLDDLDDLEGDDWESTQDDYDEEMVDALTALILAYECPAGERQGDECGDRPVFFDGGFAQVGSRLSAELKIDPVIATEDVEVTGAQAAELAAAVAQSPLLRGRLVSEDHTVSAVALRLTDMEPRELHAAVAEMRSYLVDEPPPEGVRVHIGGLPYLRANMVEKMRSDQLKLVPLTLLVCLILLYISFRWVAGVVLPIAAVVLTTLMVVGGMAVVGVPMNVINNIIPVLLIIIGISDSIHLVGRYREESARGADQETAGRKTVHAMAVACLLTSVTTAVGLASLVVSRTVMLRHFGLTAAAGVMVAYVVTITFLPSILTAVKPPSAKVKASGGWLEGAIMNLTAGILRKPWLVLGGTVVAMALMVWAALDVKVDHALLDQFDEADDVYVTTLLLEEKLDGVRPLEIVLRADAPGMLETPQTFAALDAIKAWALERREVITGMHHGDILRATLALIADDDRIRARPFPNQASVDALRVVLSKRDEDPLAHWVGTERQIARMQIMVRDVGAQATMSLIDELRVVMDRELEGTDVSYGFTGEAYDGSLGQRNVVRDLAASLATAVVIIFLLLSVLFRSVRLGLLSIPPNLLPLIGTLAYMVVRGLPLNAATVIIFSISLGLAVDGTIHVLARYREEIERGLGPNAALVRAARGTGRAIVVSCLTLMAGFAVLLMSSFVPVRHFGELIAVTVALCLVATLLVQPALLKVAGGGKRERGGSATRDASD